MKNKINDIDPPLTRYERMGLLRDRAFYDADAVDRKLERLHTRVDELEAIVDRLPKTKDGVRLDRLPGGCLWVVHSGKVLPCCGIGRGPSSWDVMYRIPDGRDMWIRFDRSYSTEQAALDAAKGCEQ
jgi:hypothetical protein